MSKGKYKIKIKAIAPEHLSPDDLKGKDCYLGVSVSNPLYKSSHLQAFLDWIDGTFGSCVILLGDLINRYNVQTFYGFNEHDSLRIAQKEGDDIYAILMEKIARYDGKFQIKRWSDFSNHDKFQSLIKFYQNQFGNNLSFKSEINNTSFAFIQNFLKKGIAIRIDPNEALHLSNRYIIEELAVFSFLIDSGCKIQIYPGTQLSILKKIANKSLIISGCNLNQGIYADIAIKKKN